MDWIKRWRRGRCWGPAVLVVWAGIAALGVGCQGPGRAPPFEWWVDPLPPAPPAKRLGRIVRIGVLVEHTGRRDDFKAFRRDVRRQHGRVKAGKIPGFRTTCHYLPKLPGRVRRELESGLGGSGWFVPVKRRELDRALKQLRASWQDVRRPMIAAQVGRLCGSDLMLLVEITDCTMKVIEAGRQTVGAKKVGPERRTDVTIEYDIRMVDVASGQLSWQSGLVRRSGYKLEGPGSMGHWYWPRDPLEFRQALRGQDITEFVLRAFLERPDEKKDRPANPAVGPGDPLRWR